MRTRKKELSSAKKLLAVFLAAGMVATGIMAVPEKTEAAVAEDKVIWDAGYSIADYWRKDGKTAPVKDGYVFGGWYSADNEDSFLTEEALNAGENTGNVYAKFVPAQVLSIKAQNLAGTTADTPSTKVRVITSMDSKNYQKIGFDIWLANKTPLLKDGKPLETTKIYDGLMMEETQVDAKDIYGGVSSFVSVWQLNNVAKSNYSKIIYVRPYWITMDGTKVEGLARYVHIEDQYNGFITIPVNFLEKQEVAAGAVKMSYNKELVFHDFEAGRLLPEMNYNLDAGTKTITMAGNANKVDEYHRGESLYASVRFKKPAAGESVNFTMTPVKFCDWKETPVTLDKVWDVKYENLTEQMK